MICQYWLPYSHANRWIWGVPANIKYLPCFYQFQLNYFQLYSGGVFVSQCLGNDLLTFWNLNLIILWRIFSQHIVQNILEKYLLHEDSSTTLNHINSLSEPNAFTSPWDHQTQEAAAATCCWTKWKTKYIIQNDSKWSAVSVLVSLIWELSDDHALCDNVGFLNSNQIHYWDSQLEMSVKAVELRLMELMLLLLLCCW